MHELETSPFPTTLDTTVRNERENTPPVVVIFGTHHQRRSSLQHSNLIYFLLASASFLFSLTPSNQIFVFDFLLNFFTSSLKFSRSAKNGDLEPLFYFLFSSPSLFVSERRNDIYLYPW
jgi:hypothetical protein